ncbi:MAG: Flp pilus assembly complex ATPase component TadA, partial [Pseudomonadales bacterium]|nr:Flp pilus assembly complex ATPase component TadA [Pseudomonadales bacterium]
MTDQAFIPLMESSPHQFNDAMEHQILLYEIMLELQQAERFSDVFPELEGKLKTLLHSEHVLVYRRGRNKRELTTSVISGGKHQDVRLDFSPASIAGYVAMTGKPVCIQNLHDARALQAIYPSLQNNAEADEKLGIKSYSTLAVPIYHNEIVIGVLQLINRVDGNFSTREYRKVTSLALMLGEHFYSELGVSEGPYDLLIQRGLITREELEEATIEATRNDVSLPWYLATEKGLPVEDIGESMESYYQVPFMRYDINIKVPSKLIEDINPEYIKHQGWVPIADNGVEVTILIDDPTDTQKIMHIERLFSEQKIKLFLMMPEDIASIADSVVSDAWETRSVAELTNLAGNDIQGRGQARDGSFSGSEDSGVVLLLNRIITDAYMKGASDIHIQPDGDARPAAVLYRVDGICRQATKIPNKLVKQLTARLKVMCSLDLAEKRLPQDGKCSIKCRGKRLDLRVAIIPNVHGLET